MLKDDIVNAIKSDESLRKTLEILKSNQLGTILRRYEELFRERNGKKAECEYVLGIVFSDSPWRVKQALQVWVKSDAWNLVTNGTGKRLDEIEFRISLYEALDELQLSRAMMGEGFERSRNVEPMPLLVEMGKLKPRTIQRW